MLHLRLWRILAVIVAVGILILSLLPKLPEIPVGIHFTDKIAHFVAYLVLGLLVLTSISGRKRNHSALSTVLIVTGLCVFYGGLIEILQTFTGRQPEFLDLTADLIGAIFGALVGLGLRRRIHREQA
jgi:VanZ family protein